MATSPRHDADATDGLAASVQVTGRPPALLDAEIFAELTGALGYQNTGDLLAKFEAQVQGLLLLNPASPEGRAELARETHKLTSSSAMFGLMALSATCARLHAAAHGNHHDVALILDEVRAACRSAMAEIGARLARSPRCDPGRADCQT
jgi:hypothetical protein